jgi:hypothetical protein
MTANRSSFDSPWPRGPQPLPPVLLLTLLLLLLLLLLVLGPMPLWLRLKQQPQAPAVTGLPLLLLSRVLSKVWLLRCWLSEAMMTPAVCVTSAAWMLLW